MVQLLLSKPNSSGDCDGDNELGERWVSVLNQLGSVLWSLMTASGRSEARLWLCNTIGGIESITPSQQRDIFVKLLRTKPTQVGIATQLLQMIFTKRAHRAGGIVSKRSHVLERFFQGNSMRISEWFSNFANGAGLEHKKGAKALFQFAFVNRDICWEELEWRGKHGQSPAVVATKPHYLLDLDVHQTVENFIKHVPEFWSSTEFQESLKDGEILAIDRKYFLDFFVRLMFKDDSKDVWDLVNEFLMEEPFSSLCHHLLIVLEEKEFSSFLELLRRNLKPRSEEGGVLSWLEIILSENGGSIDRVLLVNGVINHGRHLLRLLREEDIEEQRSEIEDIISKMCRILSDANTLSPLLRECLKEKKTREEVIKLLGIQSWVIQYSLSEECRKPEAWESLFSDNGIGFKRTNKYDLINEDSEPELGSGESTKRKKHKKERRKKRRRNLDDDSDELLEYNRLNGFGVGLEAADGSSWLLSTDNYSASLTNADLPEYISKLCFSTWMKLASSYLA
ncbi:unnamed protein product [Linum trigynum]|uniref:Uncharacterized protein n=1 Tax=Linum trigynum TaxID=586398 RepID=A0AAV2F4E5_9ROSI